MNWLPQAMHVLRDELKNIEVTISSDYSPDLAEASRPRPAGPGLPKAGAIPDLVYHVVDPEPFIVLLPSDHRLTSSEQIRAKDLRRDLHRPGSNKAHVLRAVTDDYLRRSGHRHQTGSRSGQYGDGYVPGRVQPAAWR